jgi:hypothetical protein
MDQHTYSRTLRSRCQRVGLLFSGFSLARLALPSSSIGAILKIACPHSLGAGQSGTILTLKLSRCVFECLGES